MKTETIIVNDFKVELPIGLPEVMDTPVRDSYQTFLKESTNDVRRHLTCAATLLPTKMVGRFGGNVLHAFGGLGATAQILDQCSPKLHHTFWERDPVCVEFLQGRYEDVHLVKNSFDLFQETDLDQFDILLMDMSVGTIKTKGVKEMWSKIREWLHPYPNSKRFVWFTDTACHKMHLNWMTYAKDFSGIPLGGPTAEEYMRGYARWLENHHGITVSAAMREAGEVYAIAEPFRGDNRFTDIPYV